MQVHAKLVGEMKVTLRLDQTDAAINIKILYIRSGCKSKCPKQCKCENNKVECTEFCKYKGLCEKWRKWATAMKKRRQ